MIIKFEKKDDTYWIDMNNMGVRYNKSTETYWIFSLHGEGLDLPISPIDPCYSQMDEIIHNFELMR